MAEPTAQQLARQRLAATDIAKFAPPTKRKKDETEPTKYTKPAVKTVAGEMDMPMFGGRIKGSLVHIPIRRFLDWYCYVGQN